MDYFDDLTFLRFQDIFSTASNQPARSEIGAIGVIDSGSVILTKNRTTRTLHAPFIYWSRPEDVRAWQHCGDIPRHNLWLSATGPRFIKMLTALHQLIPEDIMQLDDPGTFTRLFRKIDEANTSIVSATARQAKIVALFEQLVAQIYLHHQADQGSKRLYGTITALAAQMREQPAAEYDLEDFSRRHGISLAHFRALFRQYCGQPPHELLLQAKIEMALELLQDSSVYIKEIAYRCGFGNASDFSRFFRKRLRCSPQTYRRSIGQYIPDDLTGK